MILVLSDLWLPFPGGAERLMFNLSRELMCRGENVHVFTGYHEAKRFDGPPFTVLEVPENDEGRETLDYFVRRYEPDLILTHHYWALNFAPTICALGIPVVQVVLNGRRLECASLAVFISEYVRNTPGMESRPEDLTILPPALDDVRAELTGEAIGFIKPLPHKGVDLIYAIARALPHERFVILRGEWQDIETIVELPNVEYMEPVDDIRDFYARCRMVLVPSISEDAGTVAQECALNGIPCISSDAGGLVETNAGGIILDDRSVETWVAAIAELEDDARYASVVCGQKRFTPTSQPDLLELFTSRVRAIAQQ